MWLTRTSAGQHLRINDKDTTRNPFINFVTALPGPRHDEALRRLQQLSAMVKPLMQEQGFHVNSLEQYEWNREFAGRCWNNGEVVELVLTSANGEWMPLQYVLYVFCHELAHIKHMNHIPRLHGALTRHLKELALQKQRQGYYGDGLWSAGRQLEGGGFVGGLGMHQGDEQLPEHVCGGAFSRRSRGKSGQRAARRSGATPGRRTFKGPSLHTGAQTAPNTRGGNRRVDIVPQAGGGSRVDGRDWLPKASAKDAAYKADENSTFRKRTQSKDAREKRASAALARFAMAGQQSGVKVDAEQERKPVHLKDEWPRANVVKHGQDLRNAFERQGRSASTTDPTGRLASGDTSETGSDTSEGEGESVTEDDEDGDADLVGDDLAEGREHFTQGWNETGEQRRRRMQRFHDRQSQDAEQDEWDSLLAQPDEDVQRPSPSTIRPAAPAPCNGNVKQESDVEDDIVLVEHRPAKMPKRASKALPSTSRRPWQQAEPSLEHQWSEAKRVS